MSERSFEDEVRRLAAIEDIKQLKARYAERCDDQYDPEGIASLFLEDGVWDGGSDFGCHEGRDAIRKFFSEVSNQILQAAHLSMNPIIEVQGDRASGRWRLLCPCTLRSDAGGREASWILAEYDEAYERKAGSWYFRKLQVKVNFNAAHADGWAASG